MKRNAFRGVRGFVLTVLIGATVFGILLAMEGVRYSMSNPPIIHGKGGDEENTVWSKASELFMSGAILGALFAATAWFALTAIDYVKKLFAST